MSDELQTFSFSMGSAMPLSVRLTMNDEPGGLEWLIDQATGDIVGPVSWEGDTNESDHVHRFD